MTEGRPGSLVLHPLALTATVLFVFNDGWLKVHHPGLLSGKLSDLAGLVVLPVTLVSLAELLTGRCVSRRAVYLAAAVSAAGFALVEVWAPAEVVWCWTWGALQWPLRALRELVSGGAVPALQPVRAWSDPTDLLTLPAALLCIPIARWR